MHLDDLLDAAFDEEGGLGRTFAVVCVHGGRIVAERYGGVIEHFDRAPEPVGPATPLMSWSVAKSMLHAAVGILVGDGRLEPGEPAAVPAWHAKRDPRRQITLAHLLEMRDGLAFSEDYTEGTSDVIEMLFGSGKNDVAAFAANRPLAADPGERFNYSSGTSNIVSGIVARLVGPGEGSAQFIAERLMDPIGAASVRLGLDAAGTWIASSFVHATARDYARFGYLYLREGIWHGARLLPEGWVDHGRRVRSVEEATGLYYGAHWWAIGDAGGSFHAAGFEGQMVVVCPSLDLVVVRLGKTPAEQGPALRRWRQDVMDAFANPQAVR